jgi:D-amino peptidase
LAGPIELEVSFKNYRPPQLLSYLPVVEQVDSHTIRYVAEDMVGISKFLEVLTSYDVSLTP